MRGTTLFNIACIGSSGPKLNSTRHSFRMEKTTVRSRISWHRGWSWDAFAFGEEWALRSGADTRSPRLTFIPVITTQYCRSDFHSEGERNSHRAPCLVRQSGLDHFDRSFRASDFDY